MTIQNKVFDFFLFTSFYIAVCAVLMVNQTYILLVQKPVDVHFLAFVFFSTVSSYNFHWLFTPRSANPSSRLNWSFQHKGYHLFLFIAGLLFSFYFFLNFINEWFWIGIATLLTFMYSAPKIPYKTFLRLKKYAFGKTIFLAAVWTYVTVVLPLQTEHVSWTGRSVLFCAGQFFFIFSICILFDYRDREDDKAEGIRSLIVYLSEKEVNRLFAFSLILSAALFFLLLKEAVYPATVFILVIPLLLLSLLYNYSKKNFSDYLYYFILDGLMMLSGFILWIMSWF
ncbi:MAG TPA: UbiA family prenyltransferase [Chitinophagaceae bacterium]|nr:UbiA family prenyltransferase [Chitinophagaceae bacterium]